MKWNISVIRGIKTNKYFVSTGEGIQKKEKILDFNKFIKILKNKIVLPQKVLVLYKIIYKFII